MTHPVDIGWTCRSWFEHSANGVRAAMETAWLKHGEPTKDVVRGALNLCEEAGEVAKEALDATRKIHAPEGSHVWAKISEQQRASRMKMHAELLQVAGYAILLAVQLEGTLREAADGIDRNA